MTGLTEASGIAGPRTRKTRRMVAFLEQYALCGNITRAAAHAGIERKQIYVWREQDPVFAERMAEADLKATEHLEAEAWRRAVEGSPYRRTSYWRGEPVGVDEKTEYSDSLMTLLLKSRAPDKYRDKDAQPVQVIIKTVGFDATVVLGQPALDASNAVDGAYRELPAGDEPT